MPSSGMLHRVALVRPLVDSEMGNRNLSASKGQPADALPSFVGRLPRKSGNVYGRLQGELYVL
jgi:hypothetical protein